MALSPFSLDLDAIPLFFRYRDVVFGRGFAATVETTGRALCVLEDGEFVMAGVEPGGMAASAASKEAAQEAFRKTFTEVLFDIAADAQSFDAFRAEVEKFVHQTAPATLAEWNRAVETSKAAVPHDLDVPRQPANLPARVVVSHVELKPEQNRVSEPEHLVAA
jgi:hypothetical protein